MNDLSYDCKASRCLRTSPDVSFCRSLFSNTRTIELIETVRTQVKRTASPQQQHEAPDTKAIKCSLVKYPTRPS